MSHLASKIAVELGQLYSQIKSEVFEYVKKELPPNFILNTEDGFVYAHKIILSSASLHLKEIFMDKANESLTKIFIPGGNLMDLASLVNLIYNGKVEIQPQQLPGFQKLAKMLKIPLPLIKALPVETVNVTVLITPSQSCCNIRVQHQVPVPAADDKKSDDLKKLVAIPEKLTINSVRSQRNRKPKFQVAEVAAALKSPDLNTFRTRAAYTRKSTGKKVKTTVPDNQQFKCVHCSKIYANTSIRHVVECSKNPKRIIAHCPVCLVEVKPSGLSAHKKWHHR